MARMTVRNYIEETAAQNNCQLLGQTLDGFELWSVDSGQGIAAKKDDILYRVGFADQLAKLQTLNLMERCALVVTESAERFAANPKTECMPSQGPALFDLVGRLSEWETIRAAVNENRNQSRAFKLERDQKAERETEELFQKLLDAAADDFKNGGSIQTEMFEGLLKRHNIKCPPKTLGWVRKSLCTISQKGYTRYRDSNNSKTVMGLAEDLTVAIHAQAYAERKKAGQN